MWMFVFQKNKTRISYVLYDNKEKAYIYRAVTRDCKQRRQGYGGTPIEALM